jgi:ubiquinone/menaquinone biosynthesis C-methylase UbiE
LNESDKIKEVYKRYDDEGKLFIYSYFKKSELFTFQQREKNLLNLLVKSGINEFNIGQKKILDLGCGFGLILADFIKYGARLENLYGIDLLADRIEGAKEIFPNISLTCGNAEHLPYDNNFFDIVICFTVFSSIMDWKMKRNIAKEIIKVLKNGGILLWYDFFISHPRNPHVRGIRKREISDLFTTCKVKLKRITLAPPLARKIVPISYGFGYFLEGLHFLNTHYLGIITKAGNHDL